MSDLEKYAYLRCSECGKDNRLMINARKTGHYQCGQCKSHLMFYGTEKQVKYKNWIWAVLIGIPVALIGYKNFPDENNWTQRKILTFEKACEEKLVQKSLWSSERIENYCECLTQGLTKHEYELVIKSPTKYFNDVREECGYGS
jgi:DNA-directed RNA polymerase subunit RPC12/RpoP